MLATPMVAESTLQDALIFLYQREGGMVSGLVVNKPENKYVSDYLVYPGDLGHLEVWNGGPLAKDRLIAISQVESDLFVTDRLMSLTRQQIENSLIVSGQCIWTESLLQEQIEQGAWVLIANKGIIPRQIAAKDRIDYVMLQAGWSLSRYIHLQEQPDRV
ncbi:YqgE/AlgH family protein [Gammaproteobacteria bacterium]|nr:YqgE/AlgH family protein [Gammaproteobacteria bacterium]